MKNTAFIFILAISALATFDSCKQCSSGKVETITTDTVAISGLEKLNTAIAKDSLNSELYFRRAQVYDANGDLKSAITDMFLALTLDSLQPKYYLYAADIFKKLGELHRGIALMDKALYTDSSYTPFYVKAAELAYIDTTISENYRMALNYLNEAIARDPQNADIYFYKGNVYKEAGDTTKALSSFQTATELNPQHYDAFMQLGLLLNARKDKHAKQYIDNAIKVGQKPEDAWYTKANMLKEEGLVLYDANKMTAAYEKLNASADAFKKVIELNHKNIEAYMGTGFCYYQMDSLEQAYHFYDLALQIAPTYAGAYFSKGLCAEDLGRTTEAITLYQNCLNIDPDFERAASHLKELQTTQ